MVNWRQILVRGNKRFFKVKVLSDFNFEQFLKKLIAAPPGWQTSTSSKITWALSVRITSKTHSNSQEDFVDSFFILK